MMNHSTSRRLLSVLFAACLALVAAQGAEHIAWRYLYAQGNGGSGDMGVYAGQTDASGNIYTGGAMGGVWQRVDFNAGSGTDSKSLSSVNAAFVTRTNTDGSHAWSYLFNVGRDIDGAKVRALALDGSSLYVAGWFNGILQDDQGNTLATSNGYDVFIARLTVDASSAVLDTTFGTGGKGVVVLGGMGDQGYVNVAVGVADKIRLEVGTSGQGVFVATAFTGLDVRYDGSLNPVTMVASNTSSTGAADIAVLKILANGTLDGTWGAGTTKGVMCFGGNAGDEYDPFIRWRTDGLYCACTSTSTAAQWTAGSATAHTGGADVVISKLTTAGILDATWASGQGGQVWGGAGLERIHNMHFDTTGTALYLVGEMQSADAHWYGDGNSANWLATQGSSDGFVLKLNLNGTIATGFGANGALRFGGSGSDMLDGGVIPATSGVYVTGLFSGTNPTLTGGSVNATMSLTSRGGQDNIIMRLVPATGVLDTGFAGGTGYLQWGSTANDNTLSAIRDHADLAAVALIGRTPGSGAGFGASGGTLGANPGVDSMVCRLDSAGAVRTGFGPNGLPLRREGAGGVVVTRTALAPDGSVYVAGDYFGTVNLDPTGGTATFTCATSSQNRAFISHFSSAGAYLWTKDWGSDGMAKVVSVKPLAGGGVVAVVGFKGANAGWGGTGSDISAGDWDSAILKMDASGTPDSAFGGDGVVRIGGSGYDRITGVAQDAAGHLVATGYFRSPSLQVDGAGTAVTNVNPSGMPTLLALRLTLAGSLDASFNGTGAMQWGGSVGMGFGERIAIDSAGRIIIAGETAGTVGFGGASSVTTTNGAEWGLVLRLTPTGTLDTFNSNGWVVWGGDGTATFLQDLYITAGDGIVVGGSFSGTGNGFGGSGTHNCIGSSNVVVLRLLSTGAPDTGFNGDGSFSFGGSGTDGQDEAYVKPGPGGTIDCTVAYTSTDGTMSSAFGMGSAGATDTASVRIKVDGSGMVAAYGSAGAVRIGGTDYDFFVADTAADGHQCFAGVSYSPTVDLALSDPGANSAYSMQGRSFVTMTAGAVSTAPVITSALATSATVSMPFSYQITATNTPTSYNATGLPGGLTINTATGVISGTPTTAAATSVTISATNGLGSDSKTLTITVGAASLIDPRLVGVWQTGGSSAAATPNNLTTLFCFLADGTFLHLDVAAQTYRLSRYDVTASGMVDLAGMTGGGVVYNISGDGLTMNLDPANPAHNYYGEGDEVLTRVTSSASMVGGYWGQRPGMSGTTSWFVVACLADGRYVHFQSGPDDQGHGQQGMEIGTYSHDGNQTLTILTSTFDGNLDIGFHSPGDTLPMTMAIRPVVTGFAGKENNDGSSFFLTRLQSGGGAAPVVSLSGTPGTGSMTLSSTATDADGTIAQVQFWYGTTLVGTDTTSPYQVVPSVAPGTYDCLAVATDNLGNSTVSNHVQVVVTGSGVPSITSALSAGITMGQPFSYQITATNTPTSFNATGLPGGLTINTATGVISGTPSAFGISRVTISAVNAAGTGQAGLTLVVSSATIPTVTITASTPTATARLPDSIVGSWGSITNVSNPAAGDIMSLSFFANGTYLHWQNGDSVNASWVGVEYGTYTWNAATGLLTATPVNDQNGQVGLSHPVGVMHFYVNGDAAVFRDDSGSFPAQRVKSASSAIVGEWGQGLANINSPNPGDIFSMVYFANGTYLHWQNGNSVNASWVGVEYGTYTWDATTGLMVATPVLDQNGQVGNSHPNGTSYTQIAHDVMHRWTSGSPGDGWTSRDGGNSVGWLLLTRDNATGPKLVTLATSGTSLPGLDVDVLTNEVIFQDGSLTAKIPVAPWPRSAPATDVTCIRTLVANPSYVIGSPGAATVTIHVAGPAPLITSSNTATATANSTFSYMAMANYAPTGFAATGLPAGVTIDATSGLITGTPSVTGIYPVILSATNAAGTSTMPLTLTVGSGSGAPSITSTLSASITRGQPFSYQITASNTPTSYNASGLPSGLTVSVSTGLISGTPTVAGTYPVTISASNASGTGSNTLTLTVLIPVLPLGLSMEIQRYRYGAGSPETWGRAFVNIQNPNPNKTVKSVVYTLPGGRSYPSSQSGWWGIGQSDVLGQDDPDLSAVEAAFPAGSYSVLVTYTDATTDSVTFVRPALGAYPPFRAPPTPGDGATGLPTSPTFTFTADSTMGYMSVQQQHGNQVAWTQTHVPSPLATWSPGGMAANRRYDVDLASQSEDANSGTSWCHMASVTRSRVLTAPGTPVNIQNGPFNAVAGDRKNVWGDAAGNRYWVTDEGFAGSRDCDPTSGTDVRNGGFGALALTRTNSDGTYAWTRLVGGNGGPADTAGGWHALVAGSTVYLSGHFTGSVNILDAAGAAVTTDASGLTQGGFIAAFNAATGAPVSGFGSGGILRFGNGARGQDGALGFDGGRLYFGTRFSGSLSIGGASVTSSGGSDLAIIALDPATGVVLSGFGSSGCPGVAVIGGTGDEKPSGMVCTNGLVYFAGSSLSPTWTLRGGSRGLSATSSGGMDAFVSCLDGTTGQIAAAWDPSGSGIVTVAGSGDDCGGWIAVHQNRLYVPVLTNSSVFGIQGSDHVLSAFNATTGALDTATFGNLGRVRFGGTGDDGNPLSGDAGWVSADARGVLWAVDGKGAVSLVGSTTTSVGTGSQVLGLDASGALRTGFFGGGHIPASNLSLGMANILPDGSVAVQGDYASATATLGGQLLPDTSASTGTFAVFIDAVTGLPIGGSSVTITVQPFPSPTAWAGSPVTLTLHATGSGGLIYQWLRNGTLVAGATAATYTFTAQAGDDGAIYLCTVGDGSGGMVPSHSATLRVLSTATITTLPVLSVPVPSTPVQGDHVHIMVKGGRPPYQVTVTGAALAPVIPLSRPYDFQNNGTLMAGVMLEVQTDKVGVVEVTVSDANNHVVTRQFTVGSVAPIAVPLQDLTLTGDTGAVRWMALGAPAPEQLAYLLSAFAGRDNTMIRALAYDAYNGAWVDLPALPASGADITNGIYLATRVDLMAPVMGMPPRTRESIRLMPGWNLVSFPAVNGASSIPVGDLMVFDEEGTGIPFASWSTSLTRIAWWNGSGFTEEVVNGSFPTVLATGRAYCIHNSLVSPNPRVLSLDWLGSVGPPPQPNGVTIRALAADAGGAWQGGNAVATDRIYYAATATSAPLAPPGSGETGGSSGAEPEAASGGKGCGLGSGFSFLLGAGLMLILAARLRRGRDRRG